MHDSAKSIPCRQIQCRLDGTRREAHSWYEGCEGDYGHEGFEFEMDIEGGERADKQVAHHSC